MQTGSGDSSESPWKNLSKGSSTVGYIRMFDSVKLRNKGKPDVCVWLWEAFSIFGHRMKGLAIIWTYRLINRELLASWQSWSRRLAVYDWRQLSRAYSVAVDRGFRTSSVSMRSRHKFHKHDESYLAFKISLCLCKRDQFVWSKMKHRIRWISISVAIKMFDGEWFTLHMTTAG